MLTVRDTKNSSSSLLCKAQMDAAVAGSSWFQVLVRGSSLLQSYGSAVFNLQLPSFPHSFAAGQKGWKGHEGCL